MVYLESECAAKIENFQRQLNEVILLIREDPKNEDYKSIKDDLIKALEAARTQKSGAEAAARLAQHEYKEKKILGKKATSDMSRLRLGEDVEASYQGRWYPVQIKEIIKNPDQGTREKSSMKYKVAFFNWGNVQEYGPLDLRPLQGRLHDDSLLSCNIEIDELCKATFTADRQLYPAKLVSFTERGAKVTFTGYENTEEIPISWILKVAKGTIEENDASGSVGTKNSTEKIVNDSTGSTVTTRSPLEKNTTVDPLTATTKTKTNTVGNKRDLELELIQVPENLEYKPDDSEAEKQRKIRVIKGKNRFIKQNIERVVKQQSWQSFMKNSKGGKKKKKGLSKKSIFFSNIFPKYMFRTSDNIHAKVGVLGSGRAMTKFEGRKKFKVNLK